MSKNRRPLSLRLKTIYEGLLTGAPVWDLCCDHGLLGLYCYQSGFFPEVHFVDKVSRIVANLEERFQSLVHDKKAFEGDWVTGKVVFYTQGAEELGCDLYGNVVIAGVGLSTTLKILESLQGRRQLLAQRIILCPQNGNNQILSLWSSELGKDYLLRDQKIISERGRKRMIWIFERVPEPMDFNQAAPRKDLF